MLSRRLKSLVGSVEKSDKVIDIGCDHAYLDIYLIKHKSLDKVVVSDVSINALEHGIKNIKKHNLEDKIAARHGFGLEVIDENIDTVIISGMGTNTIIKILSNPNLNYINKLIIQSNNDHYLLRKFICLKGYYISQETVIYEKGKYYINIVFLRGTRAYSNKELRFGPILMNGNKNYYKFLLKKQDAILEYVPRHRIFTRIKHRKEIIYLKRLIK